ncbi:MAG: ATP-binding protein [Desulfobacteraceae bacterium]|jgi:signal transduction histidine kinase
MLPRGIQTRISLTLFVLLLTSMILVDLVLLMVLQNQFFLFESQRATSILKQFRNQIVSKDFSEIFEFPAEFNEDKLIQLFSPLPAIDENSCLVVMLSNHSTSKGPCGNSRYLEQNIKDAIRAKRKRQSMSGKSWAVFMSGPQFFCITYPLEINENIVGGVGLMVMLEPIYSILRRSQKIFVFYLLVNVVLLLMAGYYFITRIFMRPIRRLVDRAEQYEDDDEILFSVRLEDGELNKLSLALNQMMARISGDRERLKENVSALEKANNELKKAQKEIIRAEKLASVGRLSAGIAHEIGNPIGIILGYIELLKTEEQSVEERQDCLFRAEAEVIRINSIIRQLLNLSRPMRGEPKKISVHNFFKDLFENVKDQPLFTNIKIHLSLNACRDLIFVDPDHLRQVCLNLLINATDAIKSSKNANTGLITIYTSLIEQAPEEENSLPPMMEIKISDNGTGILESELGNIFDPFYTTKDPGKGTGLGLSVSLTMIEQMGGTLTAESRDEMGTIMTIFLPLAVD